MPDEFKIIAITTPEPDAHEIRSLCRLIMSGAVDYLHVRIPSRDAEKTMEVLTEIPECLRKNVTVHYFQELARHYGLGGVHLPGEYDGKGKEECVRELDGYDNFTDSSNCTRLRISKSCHSVEELSDIDCYDYVTLSPIFDSISKHGYESGFDLETLSPFIKGRRVVALGGVTPGKLLELYASGFYGAAMLGAVPEGIRNEGEGNFIQQLLTIKERIGLCFNT